jgi:hypothetical protein
MNTEPRDAEDEKLLPGGDKKKTEGKQKMKKRRMQSIKVKPRPW